MATINGNYSGDLRCELKHLQSNSILATDAPKDNHGKGEKFSPTDLVAASLASCMITILAIRAKSKKIEIGKPKFEVNKVMDNQPRKIKRIEITIKMPASLEEESRKYLEEEARNCPVALSLSQEVEQKVQFIYVL
ncbi:MAG: OsmC family protein [Vicingaceae bacterium]